MSGSVNKVILIGNVGKDVEIRTTQSGARIANFSLATSESWKDRSGVRQEKTEWHRIVVMQEGTVDFLQQYVQKGNKLYIEGKITSSKWIANDGTERHSTEIRANIVQLLDSKASKKAPAKTEEEDEYFGDIPF